MVGNAGYDMVDRAADILKTPIAGRVKNGVFLFADRIDDPFKRECFQLSKKRVARIFRMF